MFLSCCYKYTSLFCSLGVFNIIWKGYLFPSLVCLCLNAFCIWNGICFPRSWKFSIFLNVIHRMSTYLGIFAACSFYFILSLPSLDPVSPTNLSPVSDILVALIHSIDVILQEIFLGLCSPLEYFRLFLLSISVYCPFPYLVSPTCLWAYMFMI